jgi:hypothetical protein
MPTIAEYDRLVSQIEHGECPAAFDRQGAIDGLIVEICMAPWKKPEEHSQALSLSARLLRVKGAALNVGAAGAGGGDVPGQPPRT